MLDTPQISVVLNIHREAYFVARTVESLSESAAFCRLHGIKAEIVLVLDSADADTKNLVAKLDLDAFCSSRIIEVENRSLSLSRNDGINASVGDFVSTHDADDLISFNYLHEFYQRALLSADPILLFPEWVVGFGTRSFIARYKEGSFTRLSLVDLHPFVSCCFFSRKLTKIQQYQTLDASRGEAYEDWLFNATAAANGFELDYCAGTILFYRQHLKSMMASARSGLICLEIPHNRLFEPDVYISLFGAPLRELGESPTERPVTDSRAEFLASNTLKALTSAANRVDACIDISVLRNNTPVFNTNTLPHAGRAYLEICEKVGNQKFDDVFILPYLIAGGGERFILDVMHGLAQLYPERRILVISGERVERHVWLERLPSNALFLDLQAFHPRIHEGQMDRLALRIIQAAAPTARVHLKTSMFGHRFFEKYHRHLGRNKCFYYRFCDDVSFDEGALVTNGWQTTFLSETLSSLSGLISDNWSTIYKDVRTFGVHPEKWKCLPALVERNGLVDRSSRVRTNRLLWASRIVSQKRPELISLLSEKLHVKFPEVQLDVYGTMQEGQKTDFGKANYCGSFSNLREIDVSQYDALVYTSWFDGLPNIILEMMSLGLPVIAPDVGGIAEAVKTGKTGVLIQASGSNEAAAELYCDAVQFLYRGDEPLETMSSNAVQYVKDRHNGETFRASLKALFP